MDGLAAEREQGITIDVAYRYFETERRRFILADAPGHEQYTHNMITGASTADIAVLLVDARKGLLVQTRRHATIATLLGISQVVLAVNKMDLVHYDEAVFRAIVRAFREFAGKLDHLSITAIPVCARSGENVIRRSPHMPWYVGPSLLDALEAASPRALPSDAPSPDACAVRGAHRSRVSRLCGHDHRRHAPARCEDHERPVPRQRNR